MYPNRFYFELAKYQPTRTYNTYIKLISLPVFFLSAATNLILYQLLFRSNNPLRIATLCAVHAGQRVANLI